MADRLRSVDDRGNDARALVPLRVIVKGPVVNPLPWKSLKSPPAGARVAFRWESLRRITSCPPACRGVLQPGIADIAAPGNAQGNRVRRAPFVQGIGVEKPDQHMEAATGARKSAGGAQRVLERLDRQVLGVVRWLGRRANEAAYFPLPTGMCGFAIAEVLPDRPG